MTVRGPLSASDITQLCHDVDDLLRQAVRVVLRIELCDLSVVDAVSRLRVLAHRCDGRLEVEGDRTLLAYCGLDDVL